MTINPFISTQSYNFQFGVDQGLFVKERNSSTVPALTWFRDVTSAGLLGMVSNNTFVKVFDSITIVYLKSNTFTKHRDERHVISFTGEPIRIVRHLVQMLTLSL